MNVFSSRATRVAVCATFSLTLALAPLMQDTGLAFAQTPARPPAQVIAEAQAKLPFKSVEQIRAEAAQYDKAVAEIGSLATAPLDSVEQIKAAVALVDRDHAALRLLVSKLAAVALEDKTFRDGVLKKLTDEKSAQAFGKALAADAKVAMSLDGASALQAKFVAKAKADDRTLHAAAVAMKKAADKQKAASGKKDGSGASDDLVNDAANLAADTALAIVVVAPVILGAVSILCPPLGILLTLESAGLLAASYAAFVGGFVLTITAGAMGLFVILAKDVATQSGRDAVSQCIQKADARWAACYKAAASSIFPPEAIVDLACDAAWVADVGFCPLATP